MKSLIVRIAIGCCTLVGANRAEAQHRHGSYSGGSYGHSGFDHRHLGSSYGGGDYFGPSLSYGYSSGYNSGYGSSYYGGYYRSAHYDFTPAHFVGGRYVPSHVDLHTGNRRYAVSPGGYVSPYHHHHD